MTTNPVRPSHAPSPIHPGTQPGQPPAQRTAAAHRPPFDFVLRGYDRNQVDARMAELTGQLAAATEHARAAATRLGAEQRRAELAERRARELAAQLQHAQQQAARQPAAPAPSEDGTGFGYRAERLLRMAESEAHEIRTNAVGEAAELLERARAEAEIHRHEIEQNLIMRATALDQKANEISHALRSREESAAAELASARAEADSVRAAARQEMQQAKANVEIVVRDMRAQAARWAEQHRATASHEVARLVELRNSMQQEMGDLSQNLLASLRAEDERPRPTPRPPAS